MNRRAIGAAIAALALVLTYAGTAFAASASQDIPETLVVNEACVIDAVPTSIDYGAGGADELRYSAAIAIHSSCNALSGLTLAASGTDLVNVASASDFIPASERSMSIDGVLPFVPLGTIATTSGAGSTDASVVFAVHVPANQVAGTYTGTLTLSVATN